MKRLLTLSLAALLAAALTGCGARGAKPVIYLYPEEETQVSVTLELDGTFTSTYPDYGEGWTVTAAPDGTLTDPDTGRTYYCLFWEGIIDRQFDLSAGFCVAGEDTAAFLEDALARLGLTEREANEFIIYWLPRMEGSPYNLISFQTDAYTDAAELTIDPAPDTLLQALPRHKHPDQGVGGRGTDHRPGPRHPDPGVYDVEGPGAAGGDTGPGADRPDAHRLHRRGMGRRGAGQISESTQRSRRGHLPRRPVRLSKNLPKRRPRRVPSSALRPQARFEANRRLRRLLGRDGRRNSARLFLTEGFSTAWAGGREQIPSPRFPYAGSRSTWPG